MPGSDTKDAFQAVEVLNPQGAGTVVLLCEHASNHVPEIFKGLGLNGEAQISHAAWDPGARALAQHLSKALDAPLVASRISRLVYDCNRPPDAPAAMTETSETFDIPGNKNLSQAERDMRVETVYRPFCDAVTDVISARKAAKRATVLVTIHSFTPVFFGKFRPVEIGILDDEDTRIADVMLDHASELPHRKVLRNEPYSASDGVTHSLQIHGMAHGIPNVMLEVRNDLLRGPEDIRKMADEVLLLLTPALDAVAPEGAARA